MSSFTFGFFDKSKTQFSPHINNSDTLNGSISAKDFLFDEYDEEYIKGLKYRPIDINQNTDIIPNSYEGGYKIWECTLDMLNYIENMSFCDKIVLDLGCGSGLLGAFALKNEAKFVCFQDYNKDVMETFTIPNIYLNCKDIEWLEKSQFRFGDWKSIVFENKFDIILTSETIYEESNYPSLLKIFNDSIKNDGKILIAAKYHYFGVGGSVPNFIKFLETCTNGDSIRQKFNFQIVWRSENDVVNRVILQLTPKI